MTDTWHISIASEPQMRLLAELVATKTTAGDTIALHGDLGVGKTTFSRYLIRALLSDDNAEVPSPTFTLLQTYETARFEVRHFDLYRLSSPDELQELDFEDHDGTSLTLVEWPERAQGWLSSPRFDITISDMDTSVVGNAETANEETRQITIAATSEAIMRLKRLRATFDFLSGEFQPSGLDTLRLAFLQGDASARGYARLARNNQSSQLLMDMPRMPDGPIIRDGKTYSEIAHLAEDARPFIAIAHELREAGLSAPQIYRFDENLGVALIEDLGPTTFAAAMDQGIPQDTLWRAATDVLIKLRSMPVPKVAGPPDGTRHTMPFYDADVMMAETALLPDWYWPHATGEPVSTGARSGFESLWLPLIERISHNGQATSTNHWVLRDYHSPNLIWLPRRNDIAQVGIIDFQDAQIGHAAYDLVSLLQDARLDVPRALHDALLDRYCAKVRAADATFDPASFRQAFAILGAQRNTKILGIFARLAHRDRKPGYLRHIPRIKRYLGWCLEHPELGGLKFWYETVLHTSQ